MENKYRRGEIYYLKGNTDGYNLPVLVIQNDIGNEYGRNTIVALLTTEAPVGNHYPFVVVCSPRDSGMGKIYAVDLASIMTIPGSMLGEKCGQLSAAKMLEVGEAVKNSLGLV
jgi:mRNA-degrading endonuclease toxin of MazEF toxin-antitoxin module